MKVGEVALLLRYLYGYNSICFLMGILLSLFLKTSHSFKVTRTLELSGD